MQREDGNGVPRIIKGTRERRGGIKKNGRDRREKQRDLKNSKQLD